MSVIDIGIIAVILLSSIIGIFRGFVREVLSLLSWVAAFYLAFHFKDELATYITAVEPGPLRNGLAFIAVFLVILIAFSILNYVISKLVDGTGLSGTDRLLGVIFGVLRGAAIVLVLVVLAKLTPIPKTQAWAESILIPEFQEAALMLEDYLPEGFSKLLKPSTSTEGD